MLSVQRVRGGSVRLGFQVPPDMIVDREEVAEVKKRERVASNLKFVADRRPAKAVKTKTKAKTIPAKRAAKKSRNHSA